MVNNLGNIFIYTSNKTKQTIVNHVPVFLFFFKTICLATANLIDVKLLWIMHTVRVALEKNIIVIPVHFSLRLESKLKIFYMIVGLAFSNTMISLTVQCWFYTCSYLFMTLESTIHNPCK